MAWQVNGTPDTLTGTAASVDISDLTSLLFNQYLYHQPTAAGNAGGLFTLDGNTGTNYADRNSVDGGTDSTATSASNIPVTRATDANDEFVVIYQINVSGEEKLMMSWGVDRGASGASNAPLRKEVAGKFTITSGQTSQVTITDTSGSDLPTDTNLSALGSF